MSLYAGLSSRAPLVIDRKSGRSLCRLSCTRAGSLRSVLRLLCGLSPFHFQRAYASSPDVPASTNLSPVVPCHAIQHRNPYPHPEDFAFTWQWVCDTHPLMLE